MIAFDKSYKKYLDDDGVKLMLQVQDGDNSAFVLLVQRYSPLIASLVYDLTGTQDHVDDIAQEVFLRVFKARHRYVPTAKLATWLVRIVKNLIFNLKRNQKTRRTSPVDCLDATFSESKYFEDKRRLEPEAQLLASEEASIIAEAIKGLIPRQRTAIQLVYFQGMSYSAAAVEMSTTSNAIKAILVRARSRLGELLVSSEYPRNGRIQNEWSTVY